VLVWIGGFPQFLAVWFVSFFFISLFLSRFSAVLFLLSVWVGSGLVPLLGRNTGGLLFWISFHLSHHVLIVLRAYLLLTYPPPPPPSEQMIFLSTRKLSPNAGIFPLMASDHLFVEVLTACAVYSS